MKKLSILIIVIIVGLLVCSCSNTLTAETTEAVDADMISIVLQENPSTGYYWEYTISDEDIIKYVSDSTDNDDNSEMVGTVSNHEWVFQGISEGDSIISFDYISPSGEISDNCSYRYSIKDGVAILVDRYNNMNE